MKVGGAGDVPDLLVWLVPGVIAGLMDSNGGKDWRQPGSWRV